MAEAWAVERAFGLGWPGLTRTTSLGWTSRSAPGVSRRANSASPQGPESRMDAEVLETIEAAYADFGQLCYLRLPDLLGAGPDNFLEARGYERESHTLTLAAELDGVSALGVELSGVADEEWRRTVNTLNQRSVEGAAMFDGVLAEITVPAVYAAVRREGRIVSAGFGAAAEGWVCLNAVITDPVFRGQGLAGQVVRGLSAWGKGQGARQAALQVTADNAAGLKLYRRLGFGRTLYGYHYRRAP